MSESSGMSTRQKSNKRQSTIEPDKGKSSNSKVAKVASKSKSARDKPIKQAGKTKPSVRENLEKSKKAAEDLKREKREAAQRQVDEANRALALLLESEQLDEEEDQRSNDDDEAPGEESEEEIQEDVENEVEILSPSNNQVADALSSLTQAVRDINSRLDKVECIIHTPNSQEQFRYNLREQGEIDGAMSRSYPSSAHRLLGVGDPLNAAQESYQPWSTNSHPVQTVEDLLKAASISSQSAGHFCKVLGVPLHEEASVLDSLEPRHLQGAMAMLTTMEITRMTEVMRQRHVKNRVIQPRVATESLSSAHTSAGRSPSSFSNPLGARYDPRSATSSTSYGKLTVGGAIGDMAIADATAPHAPVGFDYSDWSAPSAKINFTKSNVALIGGATMRAPKDWMVVDNKYSSILFFVAVGVGQYEDRLCSTGPLDFSILYDLAALLRSRATARHQYQVNYPVTTRLLVSTFHLHLSDMALGDFADLEESSNVDMNKIDILGTKDLMPRSTTEMTALPLPRDVAQFKAWATNQIHWFGLIFGSTVSALWKAFLDKVCTCAMNTSAVRYRIDLTTLLEWWNKALLLVQNSLQLQVYKILAKLRNDPISHCSLTSAKNLLAAVTTVTSEHPEQFSNAWFTLDPLLAAPDGIFQSLHLEADTNMTLAQKNLVVDHLANSRVPLPNKETVNPSGYPSDTSWMVDQSLLNEIKKNHSHV